MSSFEKNLDKNAANFVPLTPLTFLERAKDIYPNYEALVYEDRKYTWIDIYKRCTQFASALEKIGITKGDTVSVMACNTPEIFEAHYSVPMTGAVLNTINIRLDSKTVSYILEHSDAKVLIVDRQFHEVVKKALSNIKKEIKIIDIFDKYADQSKLGKIGDLEYEEFLKTGDIDIKKIFELIETYKVTHFGGAPIVLNMITGASESDRKELKHKVYVLTAGAPPPSIIFKKMKSLGFEVMHVYGLTETYGHITQCAWNDDWNSLDEDKVNEIKARQGVRYPNTEGVSVIDPESMKPVPRDGKTMGEIMIKGNVVMKGYYKDKDATDKAMKDGWFHSGDLAVMHPDGYIKIQDRSKDIIISGGENISSIEIENTLAKHPSVSIAAVVAKPDEKWGEVPCAFIEAVKDKSTSEKELIDFCKETLASFKVPKKIEFCELPKTSTGKIQKFELRKKAKELS